MHVITIIMKIVHKVQNKNTKKLKNPKTCFKKLHHAALKCIIISLMSIANTSTLDISNVRVSIELAAAAGDASVSWQPSLTMIRDAKSHVC